MQQASQPGHLTSLCIARIPLIVTDKSRFLNSEQNKQSILKQTFWCYVFVLLKLHRNHKAYKGRGDGVWEGGMGVGEEGDYNYTYRYTVPTRMTPALNSAAMRAILMFR